MQESKPFPALCTELYCANFVSEESDGNSSTGKDVKMWVEVLNLVSAICANTASDRTHENVSSDIHI